MNATKTVSYDIRTYFVRGEGLRIDNGPGFQLSGIVIFNEAGKTVALNGAVQNMDGICFHVEDCQELKLKTKEDFSLKAFVFRAPATSKYLCAARYYLYLHKDVVGLTPPTYDIIRSSADDIPVGMVSYQLTKHPTLQAITYDILEVAKRADAARDVWLETVKTLVSDVCQDPNSSEFQEAKKVMNRAFNKHTAARAAAVTYTVDDFIKEKEAAGDAV